MKAKQMCGKQKRKPLYVPLIGTKKKGPPDETGISFLVD